jgi:hypothetical protein
MKFVEGSISLLDEIMDYTISFAPNTFVLTPTLVLFGVHNTSNQADKYHITGTVTAKSKDSFDLSLSTPPNSNNYTLVWFAGGPDAVFAAQQGRRVGDLELFTGGIDDIDTLLILGRQTPTSPVSMMRLGKEKLFNLTGQWVATPSSEYATGSLGQRAYDDDYYYIHNGVKWLRFDIAPW